MRENDQHDISNRIRVICAYSYIIELTQVVQLQISSDTRGIVRQVISRQQGKSMAEPTAFSDHRLERSGMGACVHLLRCYAEGGGDADAWLRQRATGPAPWELWRLGTTGGHKVWWRVRR